MRYSQQTQSAVHALDDRTSKDLLAAVMKAVPDASERAGSILLVGGSDFRSIALRRAQASLRFDLRSNYWSHAALITDWPGDDPSAIRGVEVALEPAPGERHEPARNGVTAFTLARYMDEAATPNLAIAVPTTTGDWRKEVLAAAAEPNAGRPQYALYPWLVEWLRHAMLPASTPNPSLAQVPMPSAAFVEHAYASGRINLIPSATSPNVSPEHLWSTLTHWTEALESRLTLKVFRRVMDRRCPDAP